jgi:hypothetical protein
MSLEKHADARLKGWLGPYFPESIKELADAWQGVIAACQQLGSARNWNLDTNVTYDLVIAAETVPSFDKLEEGVRTSDPYTWPWAFNFKFRKGKVKITIPHAHDRRQRDGSAFDRSPAVYVQGSVPRRNVEEILSDLATAIS